MSLSHDKATKQTKHIFLTGFSGCGKSTVGPALAKELKARFIDTDSLIVKQSGLSINDLFKKRGEEVFRVLETEILDASVLSKKITVIALGGGALMNSANRGLVNEHGILIYLRCSIKELCKRLAVTSDRPLLSMNKSESKLSRADLKRNVIARLAEREPSYRTADMTISTTSKTVGETIAEICRRLGNIR